MRPQPLAPGLGSEGEPGFSDFFDVFHKLGGERPHAHRRERDGDLAGFELSYERPEKILNPAVVTGAEREQRHVLEPAGGEGPLCRIEHVAGVAFPDRPVDKTRLAETAPARAPAGDLEPEAVVYDVN